MITVDGLTVELYVIGLRNVDNSFLLQFHKVLFREDATVDDLIDVIEGNRKYIKCVYVYNKIDVIGIDDVDRLARQPNSIVISCNLKVFVCSCIPVQFHLPFIFFCKRI